MIENTYKFYAVAMCPVQDQLDVYEAFISSEEIIPCEAIAKAVMKFSGKKWFQEDLARALSKELDARVTLSGTHSGVEVVSTVSGISPPSSSSGGSDSSYS